MELNLYSACRRRAQSLVETAVAIPLFVLLFCGILDFARLFYTELTLQQALREAGRFAVTGQHLTNSAGISCNRTNSIYQIAQQNAFGLSLSGYTISALTAGTNSAGGPGDTVTLSINQDIHLVTPFVNVLAKSFGVPNFLNNGVYRFTASTTFRNESFPPEQTN